jgi:hypothetical protein
MYSRVRGKFQRIVVGILLKAVDIGLNRTTYRQVTWLLLRLSPQPDSNRQDFPHAFATGRLVNLVATNPKINATCLRRTLIAWWILRWRGIPSDVRIGINMTSGHAWLEHHGSVINDAPDVVVKYPITYADELTPERVAKLV